MSELEDFDLVDLFHKRAGHQFIEKKILHCHTHGDIETKIYEDSNGVIYGNKCFICLNIENEMKETQRRIEYEIESQKQRKEIVFRSMLERSRIPRRFQTKTLDEYEAKNEKQKTILKYCNDYAENFDNVLNFGTSIIFSGGVGTGKTHLSIGIANKIMKKGYSVIYTSVSAMIRDIRSTWKTNEQESGAMNLYIDPSLLILDEVGVQSGSDNEHQIIFDILNSRYENMMPTIIVTNLSNNLLKNFIGDRIFDRMREGGGKAFAFDWQSERQNK